MLLAQSEEHCYIDGFVRGALLHSWILLSAFTGSAAGLYYQFIPYHYHIQIRCGRGSREEGRGPVLGVLPSFFLRLNVSQHIGQRKSDSSRPAL